MRAMIIACIAISLAMLVRDLYIGHYGFAAVFAIEGAAAFACLR